MGQIAAGLHGEAEAGGCFPTPVLDCGCCWEAVETIVDFDGVEVAYVPAEILRRLEVLWVETAAPMLVVPSGGADPELRRCVVPAHANRIVVPRLNL